MLTKILLAASSLFLASSASAQGFWSGESSAERRDVTSPAHFECGKKVFATENNGRRWYMCGTSTSTGLDQKYKNAWVQVSSKNKPEGSPPVLIFYSLPKKCVTSDLTVKVAYTSETPNRPYKLAKIGDFIHEMYKPLIKVTAPYLFKHACSLAGVSIKSTNLDIKLVDPDDLWGFYGSWGSPWRRTFTSGKDRGKLMFE